MMTDKEHSAPLALPGPSDTDNVAKLDVNIENKMKFDALGPLVVNSDGTLSRIANWPNMTEIERERTMRVLIARNQIRIAKQETQNGETLTIGQAALHQGSGTESEDVFSKDLAES